MPLIDADVVRNIVTSDRRLYVPGKITEAISQSIVSSATDIDAEKERLIKLYKDYVKHDGPTMVDYSTDTTIDAYTIHYLPRNTIIPKLLFLSLAYHPAMQIIKDEINILDLGSGTGGVVLGLMDLFQEPPFADIKTNITCLDLSRLALDRQEELLQNVKYKRKGSIQHVYADLTDRNDYLGKLEKAAPYDYIIAANLLVELPSKDITKLLTDLSNVISKDGAILFADPPRKHIDKIKKLTLDTLRSNGLSCYYPCPPDYNCSKSECQWVWIKYEFNCPDISVKGELVDTNTQLATTWSIYCNGDYSIYDYLHQAHDDLTWGVAAPFGNEFDPKEKLDYSLCTPGGARRVTHTRERALFRNETEVILRGSIIGFNDDFSEVYSWDPLHGLV